MPEYEKMTKNELIKALDELEDLEKNNHSGDELQKTIHELNVYKIKLELQNRELMEARQEIEHSRNSYRKLYDSIPAGYCTLDREGIIKEINLAGAGILGKERDYLINLPFSSFISEDYVNKFFNHLEQWRGSKEKIITELTLKGNGSSSVYIELWSMPLVDKAQNILYRIIFTDITGRNIEKDAVLIEHNKLKSILNSFPDGIYIVNQKYEIEYINPVLENEFGPILNRKCFEYFHDLKEPCPWCKNAEVFSGKTVRWEWTSKYGKSYDLFDMPILNADGSYSKFEIFHDITERKRAEDALRGSENRYHIIYDQSPIAIEFYDAEGILRHVNQACLHLFGIKNIQDIPNFSLFTDPNINDEQKEKLRKKEIVQYEGPFDFEKVKALKLYPTDREGIIWLEVLITPLKNSLDSITGFLVQIQDITKRKLMEEELRGSEEKLRLIAETITEVFWMADINIGTMFYISPGYEKIWGRSMESLYKNPQSFLEAIHRDDLERVIRSLEVQKNFQPFSHEYRIIRPNGETRWIWDQGFPIRDKMGQVNKYAGIAQDITEHKLAEEKKEKLQNQLLHAQKMDSLGHMVGGIAHHFNNILSIIIGYTELITINTEADNQIYSHLQHIISSSRRAANLIQQLMAFASKQTAIPKILDINENIAAIENMIREMIGEDIELITIPGQDLWKVKIDPNQFNQILVNLALNGRDAIPGNGFITFKTDNVVFDNSYFIGKEEILSGDYIQLSVSDTGVGMSKEVMKHIFEPFFTTKEVGKGTGLGLPSVYGIVHQNKGFINIYSEEGKGTTIKIYLPRIQGGGIPDPVKKITGRPQGGTETIMIAEDEEDYLVTCKMFLENLGYTVITVKTPGQAISMAEKYIGKIDMVITDVVMPEMNGREMIEKIVKIRPEIKYIYMSGYPANVIAHYEILNEEVNFLEKPFSMKLIADKVRKVLDSK